MYKNIFTTTEYKPSLIFVSSSCFIIFIPNGLLPSNIMTTTVCRSDSLFTEKLFCMNVPFP
ncbi:hypothetical protein DERP_010612 [Dermatophagoides pteronyssinus]|uniref:Uncharacterized protein n=1 Tax=Dermatophagoides pteronyssinus TaxID=6956 RepID=A0ABQ8J9W6_DERPT|nr:hypothetical protein DERP_010612 [Dermatophagoides pteronyssinus]